MMVVDTSALLAILFDEPEKEIFEQRLAAEAQNIMSAVNAYEAGIIIRVRYGSADLLWKLMKTHAVAIIAFDEAQLRAATDVFARFGKGIHSTARLNLCDCAAYQLAKTRNLPLLFKGDDFTHTDVVSAV